MRAGITAFLISPRFHPMVVAELLRMANPSHILVNESLRETAQLAFEELARTPQHAVPTIIDSPMHRQLFTGDNKFERLPRHSEEFEKRALILHSSCQCLGLAVLNSLLLFRCTGSTSNSPKIIEWASHYVRSNSMTIGTSTKKFKRSGSHSVFLQSTRTSRWKERLLALSPQSSSTQQDCVSCFGWYVKSPVYETHAQRRL